MGPENQDAQIELARRRDKIKLTVTRAQTMRSFSNRDTVKSEYCSMNQHAGRAERHKPNGSCELQTGHLSQSPLSS